MRKISNRLLTLFGLFLLTLLVLEFSIRYVVKIPKISDHVINHKLVSLINKIDSSSIVIIGDSRLEWGLKPLVIQTELKKNGKNLTCYNLAMPGSNGLDVLLELDKKNIKPAMVVYGFSGHAYRYTQKFKIEEQKSIFKLPQYITGWVALMLNKTFLFEDNYQSLKQYMKGEAPYFISHTYDSQGGVDVEENGNYSYRKSVQLKMYEYNFRHFDTLKYKSIINKTIVGLLDFKQKNPNLKVVLLRMPTCEALRNMEDNDLLNAYYLSIPADYKFDFYKDSQVDKLPFFKEYSSSLLDTTKEEKYFIDGSHLTHEMSRNFSRQFANKLNESYQWLNY